MLTETMAEFPSCMAAASGTAQLAKGSAEFVQPTSQDHAFILTSFGAKDDNGPSGSPSHTSFPRCVTQRRVLGRCFDDVGRNAFNQRRHLLQRMCKFLGVSRCRCRGFVAERLEERHCVFLQAIYERVSANSAGATLQILTEQSGQLFVLEDDVSSAPVDVGADCSGRSIFEGVVGFLDGY